MTHKRNDNVTMVNKQRRLKIILGLNQIALKSLGEISCLTHGLLQVLLLVLPKSIICTKNGGKVSQRKQGSLCDRARD